MIEPELVVAECGRVHRRHTLVGVVYGGIVRTIKVVMVDEVVPGTCKSNAFVQVSEPAVDDAVLGSTLDMNGDRRPAAGVRGVGKIIARHKTASAHFYWYAAGRGEQHVAPVGSRPD